MKRRITKITAVVLALVIMLASVVTIPSSTANAATQYPLKICVSGTSVNIRSGPGTNYGKLGMVTKYGMYEYVSTSGSWYQIKFGSGTGWISASYAKCSSRVTGLDVQITGSPVNIRSGPGTNFSQVGRLTAAGNKYPCSAKMTSVDGCVWYNIDFNGQNAWVLGSLAKTVTAAPATTTTTTTTAKPTTTTTTQAPTTTPTSAPVATNTVVKVTGSSVNVRSGAGVSYSKVGLVYAGATYTYLGEAMNDTTTWYKIQLSSSTVGWISGTYSTKIITNAQPTTTTQPTVKPTTPAAPAQKAIVTVTGDVVNVRKGAGTSYGKITQVYQGSSYTWLGENKDSTGRVWYNIQIGTSVTGWITSQYSTKSVVSSVPDSPSTSAQNYVNQIAATYGADGIQVAVIDNGVVTGTYNYGWATKNSDQMTSDNIFRVASISKVAVAINALKMQEQGIVNLNSNIGTYWGSSIYKAVTLKSLLSHTSTLKSLDYNSSRSGTLSQLKSSGSYRSGTVGSSGMWAYNNYAIGIAGSTLEVASGQTLNNYAKANVFGPLGMDASFSSGLVSNKSAIGTLYYSDGSVARSAATSKGITGSSTPGNNTSAFAGGLTCSAQDLAKMVAMLANDGTYNGVQILTPASVSTIESKLFSTSENGGSFYQCLPLRYKAGLYGESELYYHTGNAYGVLALMSYNPSTRDGVVVVTTGASAGRDAQGIYAVCGKITEYMYKNVI